MILTKIKQFDHDLDIWNPLIKASRTSSHKFKHSCGLVDSKGNIISIGVNSKKTHPRLGSKPPYLTLHSEGAAIYYCLKKRIKVQGLSAFVCRVDQYGNPINSKPCKYCIDLFNAFDINKVYYTVTS